MKELEILYDKEETCPICNTKFNTKKVRHSRLRLTGRDEDFLSYYSVGNPIKYNVIICSDCGYSAYQNAFNDISEANKEKIKENISSRWKKRSFGDLRNLDKAIEAYKLALINYKIIQKNNLELGNILINLTWLYRMKEDKSEENRFMSAARDKFIKAYNTESLVGTSMDESKLSYLIGELSRRLNNKEEAISWFNTCISLPSTGMNHSLNNMAREQWAISREMD